MQFMQTGGLGPSPPVFPPEGESLSIQRTFSFCLKAFYRGGRTLDAGLSVLQTGCCPSSPFPAHSSVTAERREVSLCEGACVLSYNPCFSFWHGRSLRKGCVGAV